MARLIAGIATPGMASSYISTSVNCTANSGKLRDRNAPKVIRSMNATFFPLAKHFAK
jgi:hypothetical protein